MNARRRPNSRPPHAHSWDTFTQLELTLEEEIFGGDDSDISDLEDAGHIAFQEEEEVADVEPVAKGKGKLSRAPAAYAYREDDDDEEEDEEGAARPKSRDRDQEYRPSADAKAEQFVLVKKGMMKWGEHVVAKGACRYATHTSDSAKEAHIACRRRRRLCHHAPQSQAYAAGTHRTPLISRRHGRRR